MSRSVLIAGLFAMAVMESAGHQETFGQSVYDPAFPDKAKSRREYITLLTDRNLYSVNEYIRFRAWIRTEGHDDEATRSSVLYVELVSPSGRSVAGGKYHLNRDGAAGSLEIPADALTGNYWIRSYTRWMRNFGPLAYAYLPLKVINPFKPETAQENEIRTEEKAAGIVMDHAGLRFRTGKPVYAPGEEVSIEIGANGPEMQIPGDYCLTVVPIGLADTVYAGSVPESNDTETGFSFSFLPDVSGVSISGSVTKAGKSDPFPAARLHFSMLGDRPEYLATMTDKQGRFCLTLPERKGMQELFVACEPGGGNTGQVLIDRDFAVDPLPVSSKEFALSPGETKLASRVAFNMQLSEAFRQQVEPGDSLSTGFPAVPFYGAPVYSIELDEFIQLPDMEEVFLNLVPAVAVHYMNGRPYLTIVSRNRNISYYPPLFLIDLIPVFDQQALLELDPSRIARIEVIDEVYIRGDMIFGGIVAMTSKAGDMAAIGLPEGSYFFDYETFHRENPVAQAYMAGDRIPDTRNTILWMDCIRPGTNGPEKVRFIAGSEAGTYLILVRGPAPSGGIRCGMTYFRVVGQQVFKF